MEDLFDRFTKTRRLATHTRSSRLKDRRSPEENFAAQALSDALGGEGFARENSGGATSRWFDLDHSSAARLTRAGRGEVGEELNFEPGPLEIENISGDDEDRET